MNKNTGKRIAAFILALLAVLLTAGIAAANEWKNLTWNLSDEGILTISGSWSMEDELAPTDAWRHNYSIIASNGITSIRKVVISDGIEGIGGKRVL